MSPPRSPPQRTTPEDDFALAGSGARDAIVRVLGAERDARWRDDRAAAWAWQFDRNPHGTGDACFVVARRGGEVVGVNGVMSARARVGGRVVSASWKVDMAVLRAARGGGLGTALMARIPQLSEVAVVYGSSDASVRLLRSYGWRPVATIRGWSLALRGGGAVGVARLARRALLGAVFRGPGGETVDLDVGAWPEDAALDTLWDAVRVGYACAVERDAEVLRWKYREHPALAYVPITAWRGGRLCGLLVVRFDPRVAVVADLVAPAGAVGLRVSLLAKAVEVLDARGAGAVYLETSDAALALACRELGFHALPDPSRMHVWPRGAEATLPWFVMTGDSDNDLLHDCGRWNLPAPPVTATPAWPEAPPPVERLRAVDSPAVSPGRLLRRALVSPWAMRALRSTARGHATVFMLHRFEGAAGRAPEHDVEALRRTLEALRRARVRWMHVDALLRGMAEGDRAVDGAVAFTIDDGYADVHALAAPVFEAFEAPCAVFLATAFLDAGRWLWWDAVEYALDHTSRREVEMFGQAQRWGDDDASRDAVLRALRPTLRTLDAASRQRAVAALCERLDVTLPASLPPPYQPLSWDDVRRIEARGVLRFGSHTHTHPILSRESDARAAEEMRTGMRRLREEVAAPLDVFCYPDGHRDAFGPRDEALARASGFSAALAAEHGTLSPELLHGPRRFALPRVAWRDDGDWVLRVASGAQRLIERLDALRGA